MNLMSQEATSCFLRYRSNVLQVNTSVVKVRAQDSVILFISEQFQDLGII